MVTYICNRCGAITVVRYKHSCRCEGIHHCECKTEEEIFAVVGDKKIPLKNIELPIRKCPICGSEEIEVSFRNYGF